MVACVAASLTASSQAAWGQASTPPGAPADTARYVYHPSSMVTMIMHADTVMWLSRKESRVDTSIVFIRGDSAWLQVSGTKVPMTAARAAMLRRTIVSSKRAIALDSVLTRLPP
jgi:hypothetical protein